MNMKEIKEIAKKMDVKSGKMRKTDLIRTIQVAEGNMPCFQSAMDYCDQGSCCWREDCLQA